MVAKFFFDDATHFFDPVPQHQNRDRSTFARVQVPEPETIAQLVGPIVAVVLLGLAYVGANLATRFQYVVMAVLAAAIIAFFLADRIARRPPDDRYVRSLRKSRQTVCFA